MSEEKLHIQTRMLYTMKDVELEDLYEEDDHLLKLITAVMMANEAWEIVVDKKILKKMDLKNKQLTFFKDPKSLSLVVRVIEISPEERQIRDNFEGAWCKLFP